MTWFWSTPEWAAYCAAYGGPVTDNSGPENIIVPLGAESEMLARLRPTHRARIRKTLLHLAVVDDPLSSLFDVYQRLYTAEVVGKGKTPRPQGTFDLMRQWLGEHGVLFLARDEERWLGAVYVITHGAGAYDASSARAVGATGAIHHFLIWNAMLHLAYLGYEWLDLGKPHLDTNPRGGIREFKTGFIHGGVAERQGTRPLSEGPKGRPGSIPGPSA